MTTEERFERIELLTAGMAEERRKDREEYKELWRDTQRQLNELSTRVLQFGEESREADKRLEQRIQELAEESRAADRRLEAADRRLGERIDSLGERIDSLVSAMGAFFRRQPGQADPQ
jgi:chromosome segregation ATPase